MLIVFLKILPKNTEMKYFWSQSSSVLVLCLTLHLYLRVLISNMTIVFSDCCPKHPDKKNLEPSLRTFNFAQNLAFLKIEVA